MSRLASSLIALALATASVPALAQEPTGDADQYLMNWQNAELEAVIKEVAARTKRNFLYPSDRVRGQVTVISESPLTLDEYWRVFESILQVNGFTTVEGPGRILKIVPLRDAKETPLETVVGPGREPNRDLYITRLVPLRYVKAETIANTFRPLVSQNANVIAYAPTNTMILTDTAANIRRLMTILSEIDVETYQDQIRVIPIEYADAAELAQHLEQIFAEEREQPVRRTTRARAQRAAAQAQAGAEAAIFGATGQPRFITDERTNSLIVIAPSATIRQVERLVTLLDYKRPGTGRIHVYRLQNADAEEMSQTLASLASATGAVPSRARPAGQAAAQAGAAVGQLAGGVQITADGPTNSLIIQASAEGFSALRDVIEQLDLRRPQVMVEALIMEVSANDIEDLGIGFVYRNLLRGASKDEVITGGFGAPSSSFDPTNPSFQSAILGDTITITDPSDPSMTITVPIIEALIRASEDNTDANIISAPVILTADNEEAQIVVGENIPVPTSRLQLADPSSVGGFQTSQNIERQDVGVTLRVTPQISEGDSVRLEIFQEISEVQAGTTASDLGPETNTRTVENTVYVKDGEAVMIGGILDDKVDIAEFKVPWLGDIPILGWLFKSRTTTLRKTNLLVILTPHIVRDPEDLEALTVEQRERFREGAQGTLGWEDEERQAESRRKAREAGVDLPVDPNPVRRELDEHTRRYPTEEFPLLRERREQRESERIRTMEELAERAEGKYRVQVSQFRLADDAATVLERLLGLGFDGTVLSRQVGEETLHFVQLGPYGSETRAQEVARELRAETGLEAFVIAEP